MKVFFKRILSSKILCFALLVLEFAVIVAFWSFIEFSFVDSAAGGTDVSGRAQTNLIVSIIFYALRAILYVIDVIVFFKIIIRDENTEYKVPWLVCMFILPVWTITFYLVFGRTKLRKKDAKVVDDSVKMFEKRAELSEEENQAVFGEMEERYSGVFKYLRNCTNLDVSKNNKITYYKNGETFFPELIESLKKAEKFIFIEFFIIGEGKLWQSVLEVLKEKAKNGVDVRLIYDDIGSSSVVPKDIVETLKEAGIECHAFHPVTPALSNALNNRDHRKIVVIDHKIAYTGGMNLADEYANEVVRFGYWKDTMVKIEGKAISNLIATFLQNYDLTTFTVSDYDKYLKGDYEEYEDKGYAFAFGDAPGAYSNYEQIGEQNYINLINVANKSVYVSTPYLITSYPLTRALTGAAKRGVDVKLIVPGIPDKKFAYWMAKSQFHVFLEAGVKIYTYTPGFNHEKLMLVDDRLCFVGTINFDFRSLTHHFECGVTFLDAPCLPEIKEDLDQMVSESELVPVDFKQKGIQKLLAYALKIFRVLF